MYTLLIKVAMIMYSKIKPLVVVNPQRIIAHIYSFLWLYIPLHKGRNISLERDQKFSK